MTPEQRTAFIEACDAGDEVRAVTLALQIAAHNARAGRTEQAMAIRSEVDRKQAAEAWARERRRLRLEVAAMIKCRNLDKYDSDIIELAEDLIDANDKIPVRSA